MKPKTQIYHGPFMPLASDSAKKVEAKRVANERYAERLRQNHPWPRKIASLPHPATEGENKTQETGTRTLVRCNLPTNGIDYDLARDLCHRFGGFTAYPMIGGWKSTSAIMFEDGYIWEVSVDGAQSREDAIAIFRGAGRRLGQGWTHITTALETAHHTKTG